MHCYRCRLNVNVPRKTKKAPFEISFHPSQAGFYPDKIIFYPFGIFFYPFEINFITWGYYFHLFADITKPQPYPGDICQPFAVNRRTAAPYGRLT